MLEIGARKPQPHPTKSVNVKMPKLIAMAVRWIRGQKEAKEPELPRHLKESVSEAKSESDLVVSHSPFFGRHRKGAENGAQFDGGDKTVKKGC